MRNQPPKATPAYLVQESIAQEQLRCLEVAAMAVQVQEQTGRARHEIKGQERRHGRQRTRPLLAGTLLGKVGHQVTHTAHFLAMEKAQELAGDGREDEEKAPENGSLVQAELAPEGIATSGCVLDVPPDAVLEPQRVREGAQEQQQRERRGKEELRVEAEERHGARGGTPRDQVEVEERDVAPQLLVCLRPRHIRQSHQRGLQQRVGWAEA